ncbi:hypothetical protein ALSL_0017 [Aerosticca soli]|uniref:Uncharacterized protein n=1 Tax=Aerosticca soli TaxID=2010829 RepID=A0A2Z6E142_9GAMM|nr:hypothetical protein ALSL_0017 [Aerosticca soli]
MRRVPCSVAPGCGAVRAVAETRRADDLRSPSDGVRTCRHLSRRIAHRRGHSPGRHCCSIM